MHSSQNATVPAVLVPGQSLKAIDTRALVDSGADLSCIDWDFVKKHKIPRTKLATPISVNNVDESAKKPEPSDILAPSSYTLKKPPWKKPSMSYIAEMKTSS